MEVAGIVCFSLVTTLVIFGWEGVLLLVSAFAVVSILALAAVWAAV